MRRDVVIGSVSSAGLSITSGLNGTEKVVLRAGGFLNPGETVRPEVQKKAGGA
jgi:HlyD family secretion protein